jgi:preprotein translocase subunit SecY
MPGQGASIFADAGPLWFAFIIICLVAIVALLICMEQGQRRIPVQFAKRMIGRKQTAGGNTYIPLKVNMAGIVPVIFASSVLYLPTILQSLVQNDGFQQFIDQNFNDPTAPLRILIEGILIVGFAYFFNAIQFDPNQQAEIIRQQGGYVPGVRPGPQTERYLTKVMNRITLPGAIVIAFIAVAIPVLLKLVGVQGNYFAGTTMLIAVGVALETMKQINSQLTMRNYEGFLRQ